MRARSSGVERTHLDSHQPLRTVAKTHQKTFAWLHFANSVMTERFHMNENVAGSIPAGEKAESAGPVEPFDDGDLKPSG